MSEIEKMANLKVVVFAGTTEGREIVDALARANVQTVACVATKYGAKLVPKAPNVKTRVGRLDVEGMRALYREVRPNAVIDATHPFAVDVTKTIKKSVADSDLKYLRVLRPANDEKAPMRFQNAKECADALLDTTGTIFLSVGTKELGPFCEDPNLRARIVARVLPSLESLRLCFDAGLEGKQIVAMQGPFSAELDVATMRNFGASILVTKESGTKGGEPEKFAAAKKIGAKVYAIARPVEEEKNAFTPADALRELFDSFGIETPPTKLDVALVGIGCGTLESMTDQVRARIAESDVLVGSKRLLETAETLAPAAEKIPSVNPDEALEIVEKILRERIGGARVAFLFSGDSGFYSGCAKVLKKLEKHERVELKVEPGVSSISALAAKAKIPWQDAPLLTLHGRDEKEWRPELVDAVLHNERTFFLTSGVRDLNCVANLFAKSSALIGSRFFAVRNLGYDDEETLEGIDAWLGAKKPGLYVCAIGNAEPKSRPRALGLPDSAFFRRDTPMTKEEIREIVVSKLRLKDGDVVYDVGSGTGTIAVQCALMSPKISVYAFECDAGAAMLTTTNARAFDLYNVRVVKGVAPDSFKDAPAPTKVFIGGSKGKLSAIIDKVRELNPEARVVMTALTIETVAEAIAKIENLPAARAEGIQVSVARVRPIGNLHYAEPSNPVYIFSFDLVKESGENADDSRQGRTCEGREI